MMASQRISQSSENGVMDGHDATYRYHTPGKKRTNRTLGTFFVVLYLRPNKQRTLPFYVVVLTGRPHAFGPKNIYIVPKILMEQPHDCSSY